MNFNSLVCHIEADRMWFSDRAKQLEATIAAAQAELSAVRAQHEYASRLMDLVPGVDGAPAKEPAAAGQDQAPTPPAAQVIDAPAVTRKADRMEAARRAKAAKKAAGKPATPPNV